MGEINKSKAVAEMRLQQMYGDALSANLLELVELERAVLGAVLIDKTAIHTICEKLDRPDIFYLDAHKVIWDIMLKVQHKSEPIDILTIISNSSLKESETYGGPAYLSELTNRVVSSANIEYHAAYLWQAYVSRSLSSYCINTIEQLRNGEDVPEVLYELSRQLHEIQASKVSTLMPGGKLVRNLLNRIERVSGGVIGETIFGIPEADELIGGAEGGDVIIIAGRPKTGKSSVANTILKHFVETNRAIYMASGEMQNVKTTARLVAALTGLSTRAQIESGKFLHEPENQRNVMAALDRINESRLLIDDGELSIPKMTAVINYQFYVNGVRFFMFDRIGLFKEVVGASDDYRARMTVTSAMRKIANTLGVVIIAYSQVNTEAEKTAHKRPLAQHIFGGIGAQSNATKCIMLYRPEMYRFAEFADGPYKGESAKGFIEFYTVLNNYLDTGSCKLRFVAHTQQLASESSIINLDSTVPQIIGQPVSVDPNDLPF